MIRDVETLRFLDEQSRKVAGVTQLKSTDPRVLRELVNGKIEETTIQPDYRRHVITDLRDLPAAAEQWALGTGTCWVHREYITIQTNDDDRRDSISFALEKSAIFEKLLATASKGWIVQREFLDLIIEVFEAHLRPSIASQISAIKAINTIRNESSIGRGTGRDKGISEFTSEINAENPLPEIVIVDCELYLDLPISHPVSIPCRLKSQAVENPVTFSLMPLPDAIPLAIADTLRAIKKFLVENLPAVTDGEPFPVFIGLP